MSVLSKRLKWLRENEKDKDGKWTQQYVADIIGVARVTYTGYENGSKIPPLDIVNKLADTFDVTTDYLSGRSDNPNQTEEESFEAFINDPELRRWHRELPKSKEEDLARLKRIWEAYKDE